MPEEVYQTVAVAAAREEIVLARLAAMDKAVSLLEKFPTAIDVAVENLRKLHDERIRRIEEVSEQKFMRIDTGFIERDKRTDQLTLANSTAIAAALQAQKEAAGETQKSSALAIDKSEKSTIESIKQLQTLFQTAMAALTIQINDVKSRLDKGEGQSSVADPATRDSLDRMSEHIARLATGASVGDGRAQQSADNSSKMIAVAAVGAAIVVPILIEVLWHAH
jgi:hypothetical protein